MSREPQVVALVQHPAVVLDARRSLRRAVDLVADAADRGASLVVFPESWASCYPAWVFGMAGWDDPEARRWYAALLQDALVVGGPGDDDDDLADVRAVARDLDVTVVLGFNERAAPGGGTLYNSLATVTSDGRLANLHRKLTPTHTERIVWGAGDAAGLRVVDTPVGRVGGLVCWEHFHPLARQALHAQHEDIHVAAWPDMPESHQLAARHYALEGRCHVLSVAQYLRSDDVPPELLSAYRAGLGAEAVPGELLFRGGSGIVRPDGSWLVPPRWDEATTVVAELLMDEVDASRHDLDVAGHYSRSDVFELHVDTRRPRGVVFGERNHG